MRTQITCLADRKETNQNIVLIRKIKRFTVCQNLQTKVSLSLLSENLISTETEILNRVYHMHMFLTSDAYVKDRY